MFKKKELLQKHKQILREFQQDRERLLDQMDQMDESSFFAKDNDNDEKVPVPPPASVADQFRKFQEQRGSVPPSPPPEPLVSKEEAPAPPVPPPSSQRDFYYRQNKSLKSLLRKIVLGEADGGSASLYQRARLAHADEAIDRLVRRTVSNQAKVVKKKKKAKRGGAKKLSVARATGGGNYGDYNYSTTRMRIANVKKSLGREQADLLWHILLDEAE